MIETLDIDAYFDRIGYRGPTAATVDALHALTRAHATAIPFANLAPFTNEPVHLEPAALFRKLVTERRGGYCFEQNGLLLSVLSQLGFGVEPLSARVRLGVTDRDTIPVRTHMFLKVTVNDEVWLTDVGVGAASMTSAIRWVEGIEQPTPHETRRLAHDGNRWFHQMHRNGEWLDVYEFSGEPMPLVDRKVANWYTSTHPDSKFRQTLMLARALPGGRRVSLQGDMLKWHDRDGTTDRLTLSDHGLFFRQLRESFGLELPAATGDAVRRRLRLCD